MTENPKVGLKASLRRRGVTLIEAVLYIAVALALIVGGLVFYQQASFASNMSTMTRTLSSLVAEVRVLASDPDMWNQPANGVEDVLYARGAIPAQNFDATQFSGQRIRHLWGSYMSFQVTETAGDLAIDINLNRVPVVACTRLTASDASGKNLFTSSVKWAMALPDQGGVSALIPKGSSLTTAGGACKDRDTNNNGFVNVRFMLGY